MQFTALIEYLITGILSLPWLTAAIQSMTEVPLSKFLDHKEILVIVTLPMAYVLGIYVDTASSLLLKGVEKFLRTLGCTISDKTHLFTRKKGAYNRTVEILKLSNEGISKSMEVVVSRDRIARGVMLNSLISSLVFFYLLDHCENELLSAMAAIIFMISIVIWARLKILSSKFKDGVLKKRPSAKYY